MYQSLSVMLARFFTNTLLVVYAILLIFAIPLFTFAIDSSWIDDPKSLMSLGLGTSIGVGIFSMVIGASAEMKDSRNVILRALIGDLPLTIDRLWYTGMWYKNDCREAPLTKTNEVCFNPFKVGLLSNNSDHLINGLIPAFVDGDKVGLYSIVGHYRDPDSGDDRCAWDNGKLINLRLCAIEDKESALLLMNANDEFTKLRMQMSSRINPLSKGEHDESSSAVN